MKSRHFCQHGIAKLTILLNHSYRNTKNIYFYHCSPMYTIANCIETNTNKTNTSPMVILSQGFGGTGGSVGAGRLGSVVQWALKPLPSVNKSVWKRITSLLPFD